MLYLYDLLFEKKKKKEIRLVLIAGPLNWCLSRLHTVDNRRVNMRLPY